MAAAALAFMLIYSNPFAQESGNALPYDYNHLNFAEKGDATAVPLVLGATATPEPAEDVPNETPVPAATPDPDEEGAADVTINRLVPTVKPGDYFLPVFDRALRTPNDQSMIAITIDGCDNPEVMSRILYVADIYNAKLTLFPSGDALMKMGPGFQTCVYTLHYELENCAFDSERKDYSLSSGELALQLWRQSIAASYALQRDYQQHFYRPRNIQSVYDQRTHFFIRKLGFLGIASYSHSYMGHDLESLTKTLANGKIYQFDMTEESMALLEGFMKEANEKGYKMVTMNELFGLDANGIGSSLTIDKQELPEMNDYTPTYYDLKLNYRTNAVYSLQSRLISLGYLKAPTEDLEIRADGIYGADTSIAVSAFQARVGLVATGNADVETQQKLFSEDAPPAD